MRSTMVAAKYIYAHIHIYIYTYIHIDDVADDISHSHA